MPKPKIWEEMTVKDMREALKEVKTVIVPVGIIEQHGYHLPLSTDKIIAYEMAKLAAEKRDVVVAPPVTTNFSGGELPGTINFSPYVFSAVIEEMCHNMTRHGFKNIIFLLGHGGTESVGAIQSAVDMFQRKNRHLTDLKIAIVGSMRLSSTVWEIFKKGDFHSGLLETSMMLFLRPDLVREERTLDEPEVMEMMRKDQDAYLVKERPVDSEFVQPKVSQNPKIKVGVMGEPQKASREFGEKIIKESLDGFIRLIDQMEGGRLIR